MMKSRPGFSLIETMIVIAIASILGIVILQMITANFTSSMRFERSNEGWLDAINGANRLNSMIKGIARIDPPEDLLADDDGLYSGVTNLSPAQAPAACDRNPVYG